MHTKITAQHICLLWNREDYTKAVQNYLITYVDDRKTPVQDVPLYKVNCFFIVSYLTSEK